MSESFEQQWARKRSDVEAREAHEKREAAVAARVEELRTPDGIEQWMRDEGRAFEDGVERLNAEVQRIFGNQASVAIEIDRVKTYGSGPCSHVVVHDPKGNSWFCIGFEV